MPSSISIGRPLPPPLVIPIIGLGAGLSEVIHAVVAPGSEDPATVKLSPGGRNFYIRAKGRRNVAPSPGGGFRLGRISLFTRYSDAGPRTELAWVALTDAEYIYGPFPTPGGFWEVEVKNEGSINSITFDLEIWYTDDPIANDSNVLNNYLRDNIDFTADVGTFVPIRTYSVGSLSWQRPGNDSDRTVLDVESINYMCTPGPWVNWKHTTILGQAPGPNKNWQWIGRIQQGVNLKWFGHGASQETPPFLSDPFDFLCPFPIMEPQVQRLGVGTLQARGAVTWYRKT